MSTSSPPLPLTLALEGGGALGAFTWGVLDRLLAEPGLRIDTVSGTSAGAMNGAMLVQGLATGQPDAARDLLRAFWHRVALAAGSLPGPSGRWLQVVSGTMAPIIDAVRRAGSAFDTGPIGINPLRYILADLLRPARFGTPGAPHLVVAATRVRTGEARLFRDAEVTVDALLASACLPLVFPAIDIDGEPYWDGGYSSNPPVRALIESGAPADIVIIRTTPVEWSDPPIGAAAVRDRVSEITFGNPLRAELRGLAQTQASLAGLQDLPEPLARLRDARLHLISPAGSHDSGADAQRPSWPLLTEQHAGGFEAAERWLARNMQDLGRRSSLDLRQFLGRSGASAASAPPNRLLEGATHAT